MQQKALCGGIALQKCKATPRERRQLRGLSVLGGKPWDNAAGMQKYNPTTYAKNFKTPMLIIHGEKDYRVPYANGTALYGIYQAMGLPSRGVGCPRRIGRFRHDGRGG